MDYKKENKDTTGPLPEENGVATNKIDACKGKSYGDACTWQHDGHTYHGRCKWDTLSFKKVLYCSDVWRTEEENQ